MPKVLQTSNRKLLIRNNKHKFQASSFKFQVKHGLTLIELIIVIAIIGILASIGLVVYPNHLKQARDAQRKNDLIQFKKAMEIAKADCRNGAYYRALNTGIGPQMDFRQTAIELKQLKIYKAEPTDPSGNYTYEFYYDSILTANSCPHYILPNPPMNHAGTTNFMARAPLEFGDNDPDSTKSFIKCQSNQATVNAGITQADGYYYVCND